jgi:T4 bacteriophage base plate protein
MSKLPKLSHPTMSLKIPPENKEYNFRPMLVKDEKLLLMAKTTDKEADMLKAIKQVVNNCCLDKNFRIDILPLYAVEYMFIRLRAFSIGETIDVKYRDFNDNKVYDFVIELNKIEVKFPEQSNNVVKITPTSGITLKYPPAKILDDKTLLESKGDDSFYRLIIKCIDQVFNDDEVWEASDIPEDEVVEFLEFMDIPSFQHIRDFMSDLPSLYYKLEYVNSLGEARTIELRTLTDFFSLR